MPKRKTHEEFVKEIDEKYHGEYAVLGEYKKSSIKVLVRHNSQKCNNHEWMITPNKLLQGKGCPVCFGNHKAVLGINTIWDTDRWMCNLGVSEEDAKKYKHGSEQKIIVKCPYCGREKKARIANIYNKKTIRCSCGDGKSYPEKFVMSFLDQLNVDYETEYSPEWIDKKRYDFYIPSINCIIEAHGKQHYNINAFEFYDSRTLKEEQQNDRYKKEMALKNSIQYYIELDCRISEFEWIKNSILDSELNNLFDLSIIDWFKCAEFANNNIVKEVCDYWNNKKENETTTDLMKKFNLSKYSILEYLKKGTKLGWCNYNAKEEKDKFYIRNSKNLKIIRSKKVEIFKDEKSLGIFSSISELSRQSEILFGVKFNISLISAVCRGRQKSHRGYTFKYLENNI